MATRQIMIRHHVHMTELQHKLLRQLSDMTGTPVAELIRRAVDEYVERQHDKSKK